MWPRRGRSCMLHWCVLEHQRTAAPGGLQYLERHLLIAAVLAGTRWRDFFLLRWRVGEMLRAGGCMAKWPCCVCDLHWVARCPPTEVGQRPPGMLPHGPFLLVAFRFFRAPLPRGRQCARCRAHPVCGTCGGLSQPPFIALLGCDDCKFWHAPRHLIRPVLTQR